MKLKLIAGRNFNWEGKGDYGKSILINEKLAFQFGWKPDEAIGQTDKKPVIRPSVPSLVC